MVYVELPGRFKVGRAGDVAKRVKSLNTGHSVTLDVVAIFENAGHLEMPIHDLLQPYRVGVRSREWFKCSTEHIHQTVMSVINSNSALSSEGEPLSHSGAPNRLAEH